MSTPQPWGGMRGGRSHTHRPLTHTLCIYKGKEECRSYYHDVPGVGQQPRADERQRDSALFRCAKQ